MAEKKTPSRRRPDGLMTVWGLPVVVHDDMPGDQVFLGVARGVIRQDGVLEWDGDVWRIKDIGAPYDA